MNFNNYIKSSYQIYQKSYYQKSYLIEQTVDETNFKQSNETESYLLYYNYLKEQTGRDNLTLLNKINNETITTDELTEYAQDINKNLQYKTYIIEQLEIVKQYYIHISQNSKCHNTTQLNIINDIFEKLNKYLDVNELETIAQQIEKIINDLENWSIKLSNDFKGRNAKLKRILNEN
jgi:hypothetical protein